MQFIASIVSCLVFLYSIHWVDGQHSQTWQVTIDDSSVNNNFYYFWDKSIGSGHASLQLRSDWRQYMKYGKDNINFTYVRCHGILDDDVGAVNGINSYSFVNIDNIYSYLLSINMKPYIEVSFMPSKFASNASQTIFHYNGGISPPSDYNVWYNFIQIWIQHLVDYFGIEEVLQWKFEVWNEPNISFWTGTYYDYVKLYNSTVTAIKSVNQGLQVGGPTTARFGWLDEFLNDTIGKYNIPIDFVTTHTYPNQLNITGINTWMDAIEEKAISIVDKYNKKYNRSMRLIISEYSSGCCINPFDNGTFMNDDNYYAASFIIFWAKHMQSLLWKYTLNNNEPLLELMGYSAISDVFEENGFISYEFNNLFGLQTIRGIPKPSFRAMQLLHKFGSNVEYSSVLINDTKDNHMFANSSNNTVQVYCLQNKNGYTVKSKSKHEKYKSIHLKENTNRYSIFIANWNNFGFNITTQNVVIHVRNTIANSYRGSNSGIPAKALLYRIDENNTNPLSEWMKMGSPEYPTTHELKQLNQTSQLISTPINFTQIDQQSVQFELQMTEYSVAMIDLQY